MNNTSDNQLSQLKQALLALKEMRQKLEAEKQAKTEAIAIVGMGCRFPGAVNNPEDFWRILANGIDTATDIPTDRWDVAAYYSNNPEAAGKMYTRQGYFLSGVSQFDAQFFNITPREALTLDPQQRLLLEVSWEALENANLPAEGLRNTPTAVYMGVMHHDYSRRLTALGNSDYLDAYYGTGNSPSFLAGRLSYFLGLQGPAMVIDTACSSSLVAVHLACQSLRLRESNLALAGGVNLILFPEASIALSRMQALSPDSRCKTFDASADGYARGEGCGVVVLKRISDALADGDRILAIIRGSAVNHDGPSSGLTVPSGPAQQKLLQQALDNAGVKPHQISYIETHGTGTSLGDPIEVQALEGVYSQERQPGQPLQIASVKTNIGHLESAAGIAALMKVILSLQHKQIPPHLHLQTLNPHIDLENNQIQIPTKCQPWDSPTAPRIAGVSSFGLSGINAHIVLEESPGETPKVTQNRPLHLFTLSAKTQSALQQLAQRYTHYLKEKENLGVTIADICASINTGRSHFPHRLTLITDSTIELQTKLQEFVDGNSDDVQISDCANSQADKIVFLFAGQGSQYLQMGRQLYQTQPLFRSILDECDRLLRSHLDYSLLDVIYPSEGKSSPIDETAYTQPVLFAIEYALAQLWLSWGIQPDAVMGHSVGEYVAACIAGIFSLEDGLKLIAHRSRLMQSLPQNGKMAAVFASLQQVKSIIAGLENHLTIAGVNGPTNTVISGESQVFAQILQTLDQKGIGYQILQVSHAFHSPLMAPMLAEFRQIAEQITYHPPQISLISNLTGNFTSFAEIGHAEYWCRHILAAVQFTASIETLHKQGYQIFLEVSAKPVLTGMGRRCLPPETGLWLSSMNVGGADWQYLLGSLRELYLRGIDINWHQVEAGYGKPSIALPTYPFQHQTFWPQELHQVWHSQNSRKPEDKIHHPLIGRRFFSPVASNIHFETIISLKAFPDLADHQVYNSILVPGAFYLSMFVASALEIFQVSQGIAIEDVLFLQTLILTDDLERKIQIVLTPNESGAFTCQLFSLTSPENENNQSSWVLHASSKLFLVNSENITTPPLISPPEIQARCSNYSPNSEAIYQAANKRGIYLGTSFQWLGEIWCRDSEALSLIQSPNQITGVNVYSLHPGLIDSCFQLLSATLTNEEHNSHSSYVPLGLERLYVKTLPVLHAPLQSYAQLREPQSSQMLVGDIQLVDENNQALVEIKGLKIKAVNQSALLSQSETWHNWLYKIRWQQQAISMPSLTTKSAQWLIFADSHGFATSLADYWHHQGQTCTLIYAGNEYQRTVDGNYLINPAEPDNFLALIKQLVSHGQMEWGGIVYLWGLEKSLDTKGSSQELAAIQKFNCSGVLHLLQALAKENLPAAAKLWIITQGTQSVGRFKSLALEQSTLWGLGRVIALENPERWGGMVDLAPTPTANQLTQLWAELVQNQKENLVAFSQDQRYVARLERSQVKLTDVSSFTIRNDSTYLITGGLGALGLQIAHWLVDSGARYLVLTSRSGASSKTGEQIQLLEQKGAKVIVLTSDISQSQSVASVLQEIRETLPTLRGIIHSAGVLSDGILLKQNWDQFAQVIAPKVLGAWNLHTQTLELPLDFFVLFSSLASLIGSFGQANYAAANTFLDTLAAHRQAQGLPGLSINWGPWAESGMAQILSEQVQKRWNTQGIGEITPSAGLDVFGYLLQHENNQIGVLPIEWRKFLQQFPSGDEPTFLANIAQTIPKYQTSSSPSFNLWQQLQTATSNQREQLLIEHIRHEVAQVIGASPMILELQKGLFDLGMDSLMAVELKNRLQKSFGAALPSTLTFEYPTIEALKNYLSQEVLGWQDAPLLDENQSLTTKEEDHRTLLELEALSEDSAEILLAEKLALLEEMF